jgi:hypothetical protein
MRSLRRWTGCTTARTPVEATLARRHLTGEANPVADGAVRRVLLPGGRTPLRTGRSRFFPRWQEGTEQIEYGLLTDPEGRPVAIRVFPGNTADPAAFTEAVAVVRAKFGLKQTVMVGDRGMITSARIDAARELGGMGWLTALRAPGDRETSRRELAAATEPRR